MKAFDIKRLMLATMVAALPMACGTESPVGPSVTADASVTARRAEPLPPVAPGGPSADTVPAVPTQTDPPQAEPDAIPTEVPSPAPTKPKPVATPTADTVPAPADSGPVTQRPNEPGLTVPPPPMDGTIPPPPPMDGTIPPPPPAPPTAPTTGSQVSRCLATAAEVYVRRGNLPAPSLLREPVLLELLMVDANGDAVKDASCRNVAWQLAGERSGSGFAAGAIITPSADARFATVDGSAGSYVIVATAPNGLSAMITITLR